MELNSERRGFCLGIEHHWGGNPKDEEKEHAEREIGGWLLRRMPLTLNASQRGELHSARESIATVERWKCTQTTSLGPERKPDLDSELWIQGVEERL